MANRDAIEKEVYSFVDINRGNYYHALGDLKDLFVSYQRSAEGKRLIYRVASRGIYQDGEELKKVNRLVDKIEEKRRKDPGYEVDKVEDIIGIKLVCIHPSDVKVLREYILNNEKLIIPPDGVEEHKDESGYRAIHVIVSLKRPIELRNIKCEIQIITMLQETWGFKTHGPIYEKRKNLEEEYKIHAKFLSDYLDTVDLHTESLLEEIQRRSYLEDLRRSAFIKELLFWLLSKAVELDSEIVSKSNGIDFESIDDPDIAMKLMINFVKEKIADKRKDQDISGQLDLVMKGLQEYENKYKIFDKSDKFSLCEHILHIVALVEALEVTGKFSNDSLNHADRLLRLCDEDSKNKVNAYLDKALILFCFSNFEKACEEAEKALFMATRIKNLELINAAKNSYGYFSAEWVDNNRKEIKSEEVNEFQKKVFQYLNEAIENGINIKEKNQYKDTFAFAYIVFGSNEHEIERGIEICKDIFQTAQEDEIAKIYYKKHMRRAYERMLELI